MHTQVHPLLFIATLTSVAWGSPAGIHRKCFGNLGCFSLAPPFNNTEGLLPQSPDFINTTFRLFTETCTTPRVLQAGDVRALDECRFDPAQPVKFIIHGFLQHGQVLWVRDLSAALLAKESMSVISVDWGSGSGFPYSLAAANTRVVGAEVARLIQFLVRRQGVSVDQFHLIGHSLGAHVAGYAGNDVPGMARITGLDPAEPAYKGTDNIVHLDSSDAVFVDIIHSDGSEFDYVSGFGWIAQLGDIDFYPNGGKNQPGCADDSVGNIMSTAYHYGITDAEDALSCSHSRSIFLFIESIHSTCNFYGHPCSSLAALDSNSNNCLRCPGGSCPQMGYDADKSSTRGSFYLRTRASAPYCGEAQHIAVEFGHMSPTTGNVRVEIVGRDQTTDTFNINSASSAFISGGVRDVLTTDRERIDDVIEVRVTYSRATGYSWWWSSDSRTHSVAITKVTVTSAEDGRSIHFCGGHREISNGNTITLSRSTTDPNECLHAQVRGSMRHPIF